ncbi:hypothetical protein EDC51_103111 [Bibersteinia trehalosi]|nr:hypothetical protein EDC51_103111 [Bibersteinia trehalosi]
MKQAPILLADEPIAALDPYYQIDIMQQIKALTPTQTCVVVIHHLPLAYRFCDEIILLKNGNLLASGNTQAVLTVENIATAFGVKAEMDWRKREMWGIEKLEVKFQLVNFFIKMELNFQFEAAMISREGYLQELIQFRKTDKAIYIQVAYEIPENTHETDNLLHIKDNYKKILITGRYYDQSEIDGIEVIYIVDWLLG